MHFFSPKIKKISARSIFDSRGLPTIECTLEISNGIQVSSSIPTGTSTGMYESTPLYDQNNTAWDGKGVETAVSYINTLFNQQLNKKSIDLDIVDAELIRLQREHNNQLGSNTLIALSLTLLKAEAACAQKPLYQHVASRLNRPIRSLPRIIANVINGGLHVPNGLTMQEYCIINQNPIESLSDLNLIVETKNRLSTKIAQQKLPLATGQEGGFVLLQENQTTKATLDTLAQLIENRSLSLGIDAAASTWYNETEKTYTLDHQQYSCEELIQYYQNLLMTYPLSMLEDPFAETDLTSWQTLSATSQNTTIIGDDLFATHKQEVVKGVEQKLAHGVIIKPNQVETLSQVFETALYARQQSLELIASHRSGETLDTSIVDLAVGMGAWGMKIGAPAHGERIAKYNRYAEIISDLTKKG